MSEDYDEYIRRVVDAAPPLSPDQRDRLAILLRSPVTAFTARRVRERIVAGELEDVLIQLREEIDMEDGEEGIRDPFAFGVSTLRVDDEAIYCPGHGWAQRARVTHVGDGRLYYLSGDVGSGCWHSELHSPQEFLERARAGQLGSVVRRAALDADDVDAVLSQLEPQTARGDRHGTRQ